MEAQEQPAARLLTVGELAAITGTPATTLRYYDRLGLLPAATRVGGQRRYDSASIARLMVITFCRFAGLSLDDIATVLGDDSPGRQATRDLARRHTAEIDAQIARLRLARDMMSAAGACTCPTVERCGCGAMEPVLARLRRHLGR